MRTVTLFIAMSLDGCIADPQGGVDWLAGQEDSAEELDSYSEFLKETDTVIMGWNTYHQIVTELSPDHWVYDMLTAYVVTHRDLPSSDAIRFTKTDPAELVKKLRSENGKGIWICGGARIVQQLMRTDLIDRYDITVIPTLLGDGIRLFESSGQEVKLKLLKTQSCNGMVNLVYERRPCSPAPAGARPPQE
nr:dihydrofolate reductase family protein [Dysosmobacter welbionis]